MVTQNTERIHTYELFQPFETNDFYSVLLQTSEPPHLRPDLCEIVHQFENFIFKLCTRPGTENRKFLNFVVYKKVTEHMENLLRESS